MPKKAGAKRAPSKWNLTVKSVAKKSPNKSFKEIIQIAKKVYKK